ncbi:MAG TPA: 30S ribosomal protein S27e [Acidilobales archaeon]|nr:MAG: 30S ribosomal protein S27e [Desulfurococcales archaeon ex4484_42]HDN76181.1 30S ribosomal protein S27e [Acidilobales archaeon]
MKKRKILIPMPKSRFVKVRCPSCGNEQIVFDHATFPARCLVCGTILVVPTGGKAKILGDIVKILG